jgi:hypothetical protein
VNPDVDIPHETWRHRAACIGMDLRLFEPIGDYSKPLNMYAHPRAKAACDACPVAAECLADADATDDRWMIRGGLTPWQRRPPTPPSSRKEPAHGTYAGASWHKRHGIPPCDPCRAAAAHYSRVHKRNRKAS